MQIWKLNLGWGTQGGNGSIPSPAVPQTPTATKMLTGFDIVAALLGVEVDLIKLGVGYARIAYRKMVVALFAIIGIVFCEFILDVIAGNFPGTTSHILHSINIVATTIFAVAFTVLSWRPKQVAWLGVAGAIIGLLDGHDDEHGGLTAGAKWLISKYDEVVRTVILTATICSFFLSGILPFGQNPMAFFYIISGSIIIGIMTERYEYLKSRFAVQFIHYAVVVAIIMVIASLVPIASFGKEHSFMAILMSGLMVNVKGGLLFAGILLTLLFVFGLRHHEAEEKDKKTYAIYFFVFFGIFDATFMPFGQLEDYFTGNSTPHHATATVAKAPTVAPMASQSAVQPMTMHNKQSQQLSYDWGAQVSLPPGVRTNVWCSGSGAEMKVTYEGGKASFPSGAVHSCAQIDDHSDYWNGLVDVRVQFRCERTTGQEQCENLTASKAQFY